MLLRIGRIEAERGQREGGLREAIEVSGVGGAENGRQECRAARSVAEVLTFRRRVPVDNKGMLDGRKRRSCRPNCRNLRRASRPSSASVPFKSPGLPCSTTAVVPSGSTRKTGRLEMERKVHFQSSWSDCAGKVTSWMASKRLVMVMLTMRLAPAWMPTLSRKVGRNEGALTLTL